MTVATFPSSTALAGIGYPIRRTPVWSTAHQQVVSGQDWPLQLWTYPRRRWQIPYDFLRVDSTKSQAELQTLEGFFNQVQASTLVFQYADGDDKSVTAQTFGTGDGSTTTFQLVRTWGGFVEPVFMPVTITAIYDNATPTAAYTIGTNPGQIIFNSAPTATHALTWTGTYNWLCRFDDDSADFEKFMKQLWELKQIKFTSVKL